MRRDEPAALEEAAVFRRHRPVAVGCVGLTGFNSRWFFCWNCSTSSASLCQVRAISFRVDRTLALGALSAICRHSRACRLHSLDVIIAARGLGGSSKTCPAVLTGHSGGAGGITATNPKSLSGRMRDRASMRGRVHQRASRSRG
jgi:hypothetical protein